MKLSIRTSKPVRHLHCDSCAHLNIESIAANIRRGSLNSPDETCSARLGLGSVEIFRRTHLSCRLCRFICDICDLEARSNKQFKDLYLRNSVYLRIHGLKWYERLGLCSDVVECARDTVSIQVGEGNNEPSSTCIFLEDHSGRPGIQPRVRRPGHDPMRLDYSLLTSWIENCRVQHSSAACQSIHSEHNDLGDFRLIDLNTRQIVTGDYNVKYVALSYVWGHDAGQQSAQHLRGRNQLNGSEELPDEIPQTLADAMTVTAQLGLRYVWVDLYCIDQDDSAHVQDQIGRMDKIYGSAYVTIVAMDGVNADAGLAGVSRPLEDRHQFRYTTEVGDLVATLLPKPNLAFATSAWHQRAWTMQEYLFSKRLIIINKSQVTWKCKTGYMHDCLPMPDPRANWVFRRDRRYFSFDCDSIDLSNETWSFSMFGDMLLVYTARQLGIQSDVLKACQGMLTHCTDKSQVQWIHGHPTVSMLPSLLWKPHFRSVLARHEQFPSWSWPGWKGVLEYSWWLHNYELNVKQSGDEHQYFQFHPDKFYWMQMRERYGYGGPSVMLKWRDMQISRTQDVKPQDPTILVADWSINANELTLKTTLSLWDVAKVRATGSLVEVDQSSVQSKVAIGDHWILLAGEPLQDVLGEHTIFETTDYFFRTSPEVSMRIGKQVTIATLQYYDSLIDTEQSDLVARHIVAGLVLLPRPDGRMERIASIAMPWHSFQHAEMWLGEVVIV